MGINGVRESVFFFCFACNVQPIRRSTKQKKGGPKRCKTQMKFVGVLHAVTFACLQNSSLSLSPTEKKIRKMNNAYWRTPEKGLNWPTYRGMRSLHPLRLHGMPPSFHAQPSSRLLCCPLTKEKLQDKLLIQTKHLASIPHRPHLGMGGDPYALFPPGPLWCTELSPPQPFTAYKHSASLLCPQAPL